MADTEKAPRAEYTYAELVRDVIAKGNLPLLILAGLVAIYLWRIPPDRLYALPVNILGVLTSQLMLVAGWLLGLLALFGWRTHVRYLDSKYKRENKRLGVENARLHEDLKQQRASA